ncbi:hypothetical protein KQX54_007713 [Cotesia glomerata]|uniref:Uncharacterized protein n=1 Tax=Cotesia glomerata TaxID=32391 RepID=A0AAV7HYT1_COTGL|nr:hypothetical protein KQX54_007713 [Cotesia glomerata]
MVEEIAGRIKVKSIRGKSVMPSWKIQGFSLTPSPGVSVLACLTDADGEGEGEKECSRTTYHDPPVLEQRALHASAFGVNILSTLFYPPFQRRATSSLLSSVLYIPFPSPFLPRAIYRFNLPMYILSFCKRTSLKLPLFLLHPSPDLEQLHFARQIKCVVLLLQLEVRGLCPETLNDLVVLMLGS